MLTIILIGEKGNWLLKGEQLTIKSVPMPQNITLLWDSDVVTWKDDHPMLRHVWSNFQCSMNSMTPVHVQKNLTRTHISRKHSGRLMFIKLLSQKLLGWVNIGSYKEILTHWTSILIKYLNLYITSIKIERQVEGAYNILNNFL